MRYTEFKVANFRGIVEADLPLSGKPGARVQTLVGLNESGKTTILEAINHFSYRTESLEVLDLDGYTITDQHTLIPISQRANFNETVEIVACLAPDPDDEKKISAQLRKDHDIRLTEPIGDFKITRRVAFKNSRYDATGSGNTWNINLVGTKGKQRKSRELTAEAWQTAIKTIIPYIPSILYFPNFLFEFPDRIYLGQDKKDDKSKFYRIVLQDILDSLANSTDLETHILARAKSGDPHDRRSLDGLLLDMSRHVTTTVFSAWDEMFHQKMTHKRVTITCEPDENGHFYVNFQLVDNDGLYQIKERSLGFRWFFVFLLLTHYRGFRKRGPSDVLFLFDEPASNLHPSAQAQLLRSFSSLADRCHIVYTTHSHHMVNPAWLESTFVVKNEGLDYVTDAIDYSAKKTNITCTRYREFAARHPDQSNYFRPILDVLDYAPSELENVPHVVMVEGKSDYYVLRFLANVLGRHDALYLVPGTGAGSLDTLIRLYAGWGRKFIVLLDSDGEGSKQKQRYESRFGPVVHGCTYLLEDIMGADSGKAIEDLFTAEERLAVQKHAFSDDKHYEKKHFHRAVQELLIAGICVDISRETSMKASQLLDSLVAKLIP